MVSREIEVARENFVDLVEQTGQVSPDGNILNVARFNRVLEPKRLTEMAEAMAASLEQSSIIFDSQTTRVAVAEFSGDGLATVFAIRTGLPVTLIKKGPPSKAMTGEVITGIAHPITRGAEGVPMAVEARHFKDLEVVIIDDFRATDNTAATVAKMIKKAHGSPIAIRGGVRKEQQANQNSDILRTIPDFNLVEIEAMTPQRNGSPATVTIKDIGVIKLKTPWDEQWQPQF